MKITKPGRYRLTDNLWTRNLISCKTIPAGSVIEITQIDHEYRKVIGPQLLDWTCDEVSATPEQESTDENI